MLRPRPPSPMALQALQCLVNILRSLVNWYTVGMPSNPPAEDAVPDAGPETDDVVKEQWEVLTSTNPPSAFEALDADSGVLQLHMVHRPLLSPARLRSAAVSCM